jgi:deoxyribose-phosphate aldolase
VDRSELAALIDSTLLRPEATDSEVARHCEEAVDLGCATAVVLPIHLPACVAILEGSPTRPAVPAAFPTGGASREVLVAEVEHAVDTGAEEIDMVMPHSLFRSGRHGEFVEHIAAAADPLHDARKLLKVILETSLLTDDDIRRASQLAADGGADFIKTSTGFYGGGATVEAVRIMRSAVPFTIRVKASGGISTNEKAVEMVQAGADRIGTSSASAILRQ